MGALLTSLLTLLRVSCCVLGMVWPDRNVSELRGSPRLWVAAGWLARFGRAPDPGDTGYRHSAHEVATFRSPPVEIIRGYHSAVVQMIDAYVATAPDNDLHRLVTSPTLGSTRTVHRRLVGVLAEGLEHVGQAAALRGALEARAATAAAGPVTESTR